MGKIRVQIKGDNGTVVAKGNLFVVDAFTFFARVWSHSGCKSVPTSDGESTIVLNALIALPNGMRCLVSTVFASYSYVFGFAINPDPGQPDYMEPGLLAAKLVPGRLTEPEEHKLADKLAIAADFGFGGTAAGIYADEVPGGMTLLIAEAYRPM